MENDNMSERIHLIAIGGSIMHNLALTLNNQGFIISGSDDQIYEPARTRLATAGICPEKDGWFIDKINNSLNKVILGMHAKKDNPELLKAQELGIEILSFPQFIAQAYKDEQRIVVAGSHGKTSTAAMLMHVFKDLNQDFDYLVGAQIEGFNEMVSLSNAKYAIIEGDEYLSSCLDLRPKFLHYTPQCAIITGIAWDHYNVFPQYDLYKKAFTQFIHSIPEGGTLIYYEGDSDLTELVKIHATHLHAIPYKEVDYLVNENKFYLVEENACYGLEIIGKHNLQNLNAVLKVCEHYGLNKKEVCESLSKFKGAAKRLELIHKSSSQIAYQDFAHAPSKVKATLHAVRENYPDKKILCFLELHTYSSLNKEFLPQYKDGLKDCDTAYIYFDQKALEIKKMPALEAEFIQKAFNRMDITVLQDADQLKQAIENEIKNYEVILFLGSGNWGGIDLKKIAFN